MSEPPVMLQCEFCTKLFQEIVSGRECYDCDVAYCHSCDTSHDDMCEAAPPTGDKK